jgi:hypothetical protein
MMIVLSLIKSFSENDVHAEVNMNFCNVLDQEQFIRVKLSTQWDSRKKITDDKKGWRCSFQTDPQGCYQSFHCKYENHALLHFETFFCWNMFCWCKILWIQEKKEIFIFFPLTVKGLLKLKFQICTETKMEVTNSSLLVENVVIFQFYVF